MDFTSASVTVGKQSAPIKNRGEGYNNDTAIEKRVIDDNFSEEEIPLDNKGQKKVSKPKPSTRSQSRTLKSEEESEAWEDVSEDDEGIDGILEEEEEKVEVVEKAKDKLQNPPANPPTSSKKAKAESSVKKAT